MASMLPGRERNDSSRAPPPPPRTSGVPLYPPGSCCEIYSSASAQWHVAYVTTYDPESDIIILRFYPNSDGDRSSSGNNHKEKSVRVRDMNSLLAPLETNVRALPPRFSFVAQDRDDPSQLKGPNRLLVQDEATGVRYQDIHSAWKAHFEGRIISAQRESCKRVGINDGGRNNAPSSPSRASGNNSLSPNPNPNPQADVAVMTNLKSVAHAMTNPNPYDASLFAHDPMRTKLPHEMDPNSTNLANAYLTNNANTSLFLNEGGSRPQQVVDPTRTLLAHEMRNANTLMMRSMVLPRPSFEHPATDVTRTLLPHEMDLNPTMGGRPTLLGQRDESQRTLLPNEMNFYAAMGGMGRPTTPPPTYDPMRTLLPYEMRSMRGLTSTSVPAESWQVPGDMGQEPPATSPGLPPSRASDSTRLMDPSFVMIPAPAEPLDARRSTPTTTKLRGHSLYQPPPSQQKSPSQNNIVFPFGINALPSFLGTASASSSLPTTFPPREPSIRQSLPPTISDQTRLHDCAPEQMEIVEPAREEHEYKELVGPRKLIGQRPDDDSETTRFPAWRESSIDPFDSSFGWNDEKLSRSDAEPRPSRDSGIGLSEPSGRGAAQSWTEVPGTVHEDTKVFSSPSFSSKDVDPSEATNINFIVPPAARSFCSGDINDDPSNNSITDDPLNKTAPFFVVPTTHPSTAVINPSSCAQEVEKKEDDGIDRHDASSIHDDPLNKTQDPNHPMHQPPFSLGGGGDDFSFSDDSDRWNKTAENQQQKQQQPFSFGNSEDDQDLAWNRSSENHQQQQHIFSLGNDDDDDDDNNFDDSLKKTVDDSPPVYNDDERYNNDPYDNKVVENGGRTSSFVVPNDDDDDDDDSLDSETRAAIKASLAQEPLPTPLLLGAEEAAESDIEVQAAIKASLAPLAQDGSAAPQLREKGSTAESEISSQQKEEKEMNFRLEACGKDEAREDNEVTLRQEENDGDNGSGREEHISSGGGVDSNDYSDNEVALEPSLPEIPVSSTKMIEKSVTRKQSWASVTSRPLDVLPVRKQETKARDESLKEASIKVRSATLSGGDAKKKGAVSLESPTSEVSKVPPSLPDANKIGPPIISFQDYSGPERLWPAKPGLHPRFKLKRKR